MIDNSNEEIFSSICDNIFQFQYQNNLVYKRWVDSTKKVKKFTAYKYAYLPIRAWKKYGIVSGNFSAEVVFSSSGTTGSSSSLNYIRDLQRYHLNCKNAFEESYGDVSNYCFLALLPSYLERKNSSLVSMVNYFTKESNNALSSMYLDNFEKLATTLLYCKSHKIPTILIGVTFALIDFVERYQLDFPSLIVMVTGGMKGRRKELSVDEVYSKLKSAFNTKNIHAEYGMTELHSQAYSQAEGIYTPSKTMKVWCSELNDPLSIEKVGRPGIVNIIDLANIDTCSFICTEDVGIMHDDGKFEILGRLEGADIRGCNFML